MTLAMSTASPTATLPARTEARPRGSRAAQKHLALAAGADLRTSGVLLRSVARGTSNGAPLRAAPGLPLGSQPCARVPSGLQLRCSPSFAAVSAHSGDGAMAQTKTAVGTIGMRRQSDAQHEADTRCQSALSNA